MGSSIINSYIEFMNYLLETLSKNLVENNSSIAKSLALTGGINSISLPFISVFLMYIAALSADTLLVLRKPNLF